MSVSINPAGAAAVVGTLDTTLFLAKRPGLFTRKPGRAASSVAMIALWSSAATRAIARDEVGAYELALAGLLAVMNAGLLGLHIRAKAATPRVYLSAAAAAVVLVDTLRRR